MPPLAVIMAHAPGQTESLLNIIVGLGLTVTVAVAVAVPPLLSVHVTVYIVVVVGLAVTLAPVVDERFVEGDQVYV